MGSGTGAGMESGVGDDIVIPDPLPSLVLMCLQGPARDIHCTLKNSSMTISNMIGPVEKMALANHPVCGFYYMVVGPPQVLM